MSTPDPLPSWNEGDAKRAILAFVDAVTDEAGPDHVPPAERLAVFDNDGTLWPEQPLYIQLAFALDRVKQLAGEHPEWKTTQPFQAVLEGDMAALGKAGLAGIEQIIGATHAGMTSDEFERIASDWFESAAAPPLPAALHRTRLSTDGRGPRRICGPTGSGPTSSPAVASSSCARSPSRMYGIPPDQVDRQQRQDPLRAAGRDAGARSPCRHRLLRRQGGQAGRDPEVHRPAADRRLRQLRRRPADAPVDRRRTGPQPHGPRRPHRCRSGVRLPGLADGDAEARARGGQSARLDGRQHEGRLERRSSPSSDSRPLALT